MANDVFANGREIACKAGSGKSVCAFPDVCFTPPENPATPPGTPIPYPNTGMASDTTSGSKKVKISRKEVMLKNKSHFKKSIGDEAGCAAKKGVITSVNRGKVYFNAWSMDVKIEGQNAVRHLDLTTHNHASFPGNTPTWPYLDTMMMSDPSHACVQDQIKEMEACQNYKPYGEEDPCPDIGPLPTPPDPFECDLDPDVAQQLADNVRFPSLRKAKDASLGEEEIKGLKNQYKSSGSYESYKRSVDAHYQELAYETSEDECLSARRCQVVPYKPTGDQPGCCPGQTGHHLVEASSFFTKGRGGKNSEPWPGCENYDTNDAPCICVEGPSNTSATHGLMHTFQGAAARNAQAGGEVTYAQSRDAAASSVTTVFPEGGCNEECVKAQLDNYHNERGIEDGTKIRASPSGRTSQKAVDDAQALCERKSARLADRVPGRADPF